MKKEMGCKNLKYMVSILIYFSFLFNNVLAQDDINQCYYYTKKTIKISPQSNHHLKWQSKCYQYYYIDVQENYLWKHSLIIKSYKKDSVFYFSYNISDSTCFRLRDPAGKYYFINLNSHSLCVFFDKGNTFNGWQVKVSDSITFSRNIKYSIIDVNGNVVMSGNDSVIYLSHLKSSLYYLNIEENVMTFFKK